MGSKGDVPPPPDYRPIAEASKEAAQLSYKLGQEQLAWAKAVYAKDSALVQRVVDDFLKAANLNYESAVKDRARYEQLFQPLENELAADAASYASQERKDLEMGRAQAQVAQQFEAARQNAQRELESYGLNPAATRYAALDVGLRAQEAAAKAAAANNAAQNVDAIARALRSEAINVGRGYPGQIAQTYNTALQGSQGAVQSTLSNSQTGGQLMGRPTEYMGLGNQALGVWGDALTEGYKAQLAYYNAKNSQSSGIGSALGLIGGLGFKLLGFDEGGSVDPNTAASATAVPATPPTTDGGPVPAQVSPSHGAVPDDVPARLSVGEFIIPEEAVRWHGEKTFYDLIDKAQKGRVEAKQRTGAVPTVALPPQGRAALPVG